jgi:hypothetical protein
MPMPPSAAIARAPLDQGPDPFVNLQCAAKQDCKCQI